MVPTPLRPPSPSAALDADGPVGIVGEGEAAPPGAEGATWPTVFDTPSTVERVWIDFVAAQGNAAARHGLRRALAFARARHGEQTRRGSETPYWVHLVRVAMEVVRYGEGAIATMQAALLHDVVEDTSTTLEEVRAGFGGEVAELVRWLTCPEPSDALPAYYERLQREAPFRAQILKIADRTDNLRSIQALVLRTGDRHRRWAGTYLGRTVWQVLPLASGAPSIARVALVTAMADLAPLVEQRFFTRS